MVRKGRRRELSGLAASPGLALGAAHRLVPREIRATREEIPPRAVGAEVRRFRRALEAARGEIRGLRERLGRNGEDPGTQILDSHLMILQDRELMREIVEAIKAERLCGPYVVQRVFLAKAHYLESLANELFRARAADIRDVSNRLLGHLLADARAVAAQFPEGAVVLAADIAPSDVAALGPAGVSALVTQRGTLVSHVTILARSRGIPAVVALGEGFEEIHEGELLLVDGTRGRVIVAPSPEDIALVERWRADEARLARLLSDDGERPAETRDGRRVELYANIDRPADAAAALAAGAEGVGLFRTEFFFMDANRFPDEETQLAAYRQVVRALEGRPATIRTLDLGGDKQAALMGIAAEDNPYLGLRGVRFSLAHPEVFRTQLRALARAGAEGPLRILVPMVGSVDQMRVTRRLLAEVSTETGVAAPALGPMIELPAAVLMGDALARESQFFSIGSNDLIQYSLAVDRGNGRIASLYDPLDPAVLRAIDLTVRHAHAAGIPVGSCGEMSGELPGLLLLIGLGLDELSVASYLIGRVKAIIRRVSAADLRRLALRCLEADGAGEVRRLIAEELRRGAQFRVEEEEGRMVCRWEPED